MDNIVRHTVPPSRLLRKTSAYIRDKPLMQVILDTFGLREQKNKQLLLLPVNSDELDQFREETPEKVMVSCHSLRHNTQNVQWTHSIIIKPLTDNYLQQIDL